MCGIAACIGKEKSIDKTRFDNMTDIIKHRGPDDRGVYFHNNLALGHRRLAIIELSKDGRQPFELVDGYVLVYNGEIYNYIELRDYLQSNGHDFRTKTDTEVVIHAYAEWGEECVSHFNGMWAFVLYDIRNNKLFCSRDRFGVKPFYYTDQEGMFLIASEIKQFFEMLDNRPEANRDLLLQYIVRGHIEQPPYTLFKNIYQLEPGTNLFYDLSNNQVFKKRYYDIGDNVECKNGYEEACRQFKDSFYEAIKLRLRADVPIGYFLSGGLDSSAIVCAANQIVSEKEENLEQYSVSSCFEDKKYDEQEYIDEVLKATRVSSYKIFPEEKTMIDELDKLIWHMDEPIAGTSGFAQWSVCKAAREKGLTVMLDGQGSDEQLAGYADFYYVLFANALKTGGIRKLKEEINYYIDLKKPNNPGKTRFWMMISAIKDYIVPEAFDKLIKRIYVEFFDQLPFDKAVVRKAVAAECIYPRRNPREFIKAYMENELLYQMHQGDRYSMAFSIENRNPFLDFGLVNLIYRMPYEYKIRKGYTKAVLRDALDGVLPTKVQKRVSKFGFETPGDKWFSENEEFYHGELVKALKKYESLFDTQKVLKWCESNQGDKTRNALVWRIIDSARWANIFNVSI